MSFCPTCGRQRTGNVRYCGGCGRDFGVAATDSSSTALAAEPAIGPPRSDPSAEESLQTVTVRPADVAAAPMPVPPVPARPEHQAPQERPDRRRTLWVLVTVIALLAAGGGAFALVKTTVKQPTAQPPGHAPTLTAPPVQPASTQASVSPSPSAFASPSASPSPSPSTSPGVVSIAPGVQPASPQVQVVLSQYFQGINDHNYAEFASTLTAQDKASQSKSSFDSGYATTTDSGMTLTSLTSAGNGDLTATVTFISRQSPSNSVDDSACNDWTVNLSLVPGGTGYLISPGPSSYTDC